MKTGPVFAIPCDRAQDLVGKIDALKSDDPELLQFADYLRSFETGLALVCVAEEDFILWPGGPDIRDYQFGGPNSRMTVVHGDKVYSNDPADLTSHEEHLKTDETDEVDEK